MQVESSPDGRRVYVSNYGSDTVSVIDVASLSVIATIPVGDAPYGVAASPDNLKVFVSHDSGTAADVVWVIDVPNMTAGLAFVLPNQSDAQPTITFHPNGSEFWIKNGCGDGCTIRLSYPDLIVLGQLPGEIAGANANENHISFVPGTDLVYSAHSCGCCGHFDRTQYQPSIVFQGRRYEDGQGSAKWTVAAPAGGIVYLARHRHCWDWAGVVRKVSAVSDSLLASVTIPDFGSGGGAISADGSLLYCTGSPRYGGPGAVAVIDTATMSVLNTISVGDQPFGIAITPESPSTPPNWASDSIPNLPSGTLWSSVYTRSCNDVFVLTTRVTPGTADIRESFLFHYDGTTWNQVLHLPGLDMGRVYGVGQSEVFVTANQTWGTDQGGRIFRSVDNGLTWVQQVLPPNTEHQFVDLIAGTENNVHVRSDGGFIRFNGATWEVVLSNTDGYSGPYGMYLLDPFEGYWVSCWGWGKWDGTAWAFNGIQFDFCDVYGGVWGIRDGDGALHLYAVGQNNWSNGVRVWRFNEQTQSFGSKYGYVFADGSGYDIGGAYGMWGSAADDVYVIGNLADYSSGPRKARVYHYDGVSWSRITAVGQPASQVVSISGSGPDNVWISLADGSLLRYGTPCTTVNSPPVANCRSITVAADESCSASASVDDGSFDPDGDAITVTQSPAGPYPVGTTTVTLTVTDSHGASASCTAAVTVDDAAAPEPEVAVLPTVSGQCAVTLVPPLARDACDGVLSAETQDPVVYTEQGIYTVDWVYTDSSGNRSGQSQTVVVEDTEPPYVVCPSSLAIPAAPLACSTVVNGIGPVSVDDNCIGYLITYTLDGATDASGEGDASGQTFNLGTTHVTYTVVDVGGHTASCSFEVTVLNPAPQVTLTGPVVGSLYPVNTPVAFSASFTDAGGGTHTAAWQFDGLSPNPGDTSLTEPNGATPGTATAMYSFSAAGVYRVKLTISDSCGGSGVADRIDGMELLVVVYDPSAGFVTGGGWIHSMPGAYVADPTLAGRANFGFVSKYQKGANVPVGQTEFIFKAGGLNFHSATYQWLVVAGAKAQFKGTGKLNGVGNYGFLLTATDGQLDGGGGVDRFRIKIWDVSNAGALVYDNALGASDDIDTASPQALAGGSIVIHK